jgi:TolB-like protein
MVAKIEWEAPTTERFAERLTSEATPAAPLLEELQPPPVPGEPPPGAHAKTAWIWAAGGVLGLALVFLFSLHGRNASPVPAPSAAIVRQPQSSVAVLPFLDLTQGMKEEEFADGITEELIDKISKVPGLRVPPPTSAFYFKGKQVPVAEIAHTLGVAYVLDGSVRKSGSWVRVDARLTRADSGYVIWSETYDQPMTNILMVQDDIAAAVTKALKVSIPASPDH